MCVAGGATPQAPQPLCISPPPAIAPASRCLLSCVVRAACTLHTALGRAKPEAYSALIRAGDADGLMALLTDVAVERAVVERVRLKAATFGSDINPAAAGAGSSSGGGAAAAAADGDGGSSAAQQQQQQRFKIQPDVLAAMYDKIVMPLTKDVQVEYLLHRLDHEQ